MTDVTAGAAAPSASKTSGAAPKKEGPKTVAGVDADALAERAKTLASDVNTRAQETYGQVRRAVADGAETARDWAADQSDVLRDTVQTKPFISIGVSAASAFAAGLILGVLLARR